MRLVLAVVKMSHEVTFRTILFAITVNGRMLQWYESAGDAAKVVLLTLVLTVVLEIWSIDTVHNLWQQPGGKELHREAWISSIRNPLLWGLPVYVFAASVFCVGNGLDETWFDSLRSVFSILFFHACQYYAIHRAFHEDPQLYQRFHRFHHRFNTYTPPSAANAVTMGEYVLAYLAPFSYHSCWSSLLLDLSKPRR
jgi:sterol desaturase/sphingolipid hydroxylase (fatty acid hydroxylase superfamily)